MKKSTDKTLFRFIIALVCLLLPFSTQAGILDTFEKSSTKPKLSKPAGHASGSKGGSVSSAFAGAAIDATAPLAGLLMIGGMAQGGMTSYERVNQYLCKMESPMAKKPGEPLIPFARADMAYRHINSNVNAVDYRLEGGFGPIAVEFNHSIYNEEHLDKTDNDLDIKRISGLYRMSFGRCVETDIGMGALTVDGERRNTGFSFSLPVLFHFSKHAGIEFRPAWATVNGLDSSEYDIGLMLTRKYASIKAGYRTIRAERESLNGPYAGLSFRF